ncbi:hypothetical protein DPMN_004015 [Dreissena polymorpha]|uniref:Uncharacterized protein n=1 Tax=Dreissena polymorpha TaxID=45954 RepID=A0A9D4MM15_DREPO|nr:hypothetical protein DPMN_004015 [Dreissena polymorpha]
MASGEVGILGVNALRPVVLVKCYGSGYATTRAHNMGVFIVMFMRRGRRSLRGVKDRPVQSTGAGQTGARGPSAVSRVELVPTPGTGHATTLHPPTVELTVQTTTMKLRAAQLNLVQLTAAGPGGAFGLSAM